MIAATIVCAAVMAAISGARGGVHARLLLDTSIDYILCDNKVPAAPPTGGSRAPPALLAPEPTPTIVSMTRPVVSLSNGCSGTLYKTARPPSKKLFPHGGAGAVWAGKREAAVSGAPCRLGNANSELDWYPSTGLTSTGNDVPQVG